MNHPNAEIKKLFGHSTVGSLIGDVHPSLRNMISLEVEKFESKSISNLDLLFVALPSGQAMNVITQARTAGVKVIDLGGDFRLDNPNIYSQYYKHEHTAVNLLNESVYGLSEWNETAIKTAQLIANPGCYPTSVLLALLPLVTNNVIDQNFISIVSYSGTSGAGKTASANMIFSEINESVRAYKVGNHQHIPEIRQYLKQFGGSESSFSFTPHLLPVTRGIYTTINVLIKNGINEKDITNAFSSAYLLSPFIRLFAPAIPEMKDVLHTNFCDIGFKLIDNKILTVFSTIDNLVKGAAGQAIQNMNIMFGLEQTEGLLRCITKN
jgi:N-acetyl-gamma-glutamyl-phosphate reductase